LLRAALISPRRTLYYTTRALARKMFLPQTLYYAARSAAQTTISIIFDTK
jgi:hypothetical protein